MRKAFLTSGRCIFEFRTKHVLRHRRSFFLCICPSLFQFAPISSDRRLFFVFLTCFSARNSFILFVHFDCLMYIGFFHARLSAFLLIPFFMIPKINFCAYMRPKSDIPSHMVSILKFYCFCKRLSRVFLNFQATFHVTFVNFFSVFSQKEMFFCFLIFFNLHGKMETA